MPYDNLQQLITHSSSARRYFLSLPVEMQMALHEQDATIHTAAELHAREAATWAYQRQIAVSRFYEK